MSIITGDDDETIQRDRANEAIRSVTCEDRGEGLKPRHVYVDRSGECQCKKGPRLDERRVR